MSILRTLLAQATKAPALLALSFILFPLSSHAACTFPTGNAGEVVYNASDNVMQYCNGTNWVRAGAAIPSASGTACTNPTGPEGAVIYNSPTGVVQFCNGDNWVDTACAATRTPGGSGCTSPVGTPGALAFETTSKELQFCDSTNWVAMGWPCASSGLTDWSLATQAQKMTASDGHSSAYFGFRVAIDKDVAAIAAVSNNTRGSNAGVVYIFKKNGAGSWTQQQKLYGSDIGASSQFGRTVDIKNGVLVVGAVQLGVTGAAYVFTESGGTWTQSQKLLPSDTGVARGFGNHAKLVDANTLFIGSDDTNYRGRVYVFTRSGGTWTEQQILTASVQANSARFGEAFDVIGDMALIGSRGAAGDKGAVYVFTRSGGVWSQQHIIASPDNTNGINFGSPVVMDGSRVLIGAEYDRNGGNQSGSAYIYKNTGGTTWVQEQRLIPSDAANGERISYYSALGLKNNFAMVGGVMKSGAGAVYAFQLQGGTWTEKKKLLSSDIASGDRFGVVGFDGNSLIIGAFEDDSGAGSAYVFAVP